MFRQFVRRSAAPSLARGFSSSQARNELAPTFMLNTGATIPAVGLGTWLSMETHVYNAVLTALEAGYRHIDTAWIYQNEKQVGQAIRDSGIPRGDIFVTSKAWITQYKDPQAALEHSLENLGLDYVDLYLLHFPIARTPDPNNPYSKGLKNDTSLPFVEVWKKFQILPQDKAFAVGVSNFNIPRLRKLLTADSTERLPSVNQVELHPWLPQQDLVDYCQDRNITVQAYSPLARNQLSDPIVNKIADKHGVTAHQILLSWGVDRGTVVLPKSVTPERIISNLHVIELDDADMKELAKLGEHPQRMLPNKGMFDNIDIYDDTPMPLL